MKKMKKGFSLLLAAMMIWMMAGCSSTVDQPVMTEDVTPASDSETSSTDTTEETTSQEAEVDLSEQVDLVFYVMGNAPEDEEMVESEINQILLEKLNATVDFQFSTWTDWSRKYNLVLTSASADLIYVASWNNFGNLATSGAFLELDDLLAQYGPDMKGLIDDSMLNVCRANGELYAIPNTWPEYTSIGIKYREDLRAMYDLPVPDSIENFEKFVLGIKENMPEQGLMTETTLESTGLQTAFDAVNIFNIKYPWVDNNGLSYGLAANYNTPGDVYDYWYSQDFVDDMKLMKKWADLGFWSRSALSDANDDESYANGLCVVEVSGQNPNKNIAAVNAFAKDHPDWISQYYAYGETTGVIYPTSPIQNATAITRTSENPERAMMVLNLMMTDQKLNNLVQYGVEGVHYEVDDSGIYHNLSEKFNYEGFNTWNLRNDDYKLAQESDTILLAMFDKYKEIGAKTNTPNVNIKAGFTEDYSEYEVERSAVSDVMRQYLAPIQAGFVDDVEGAIAEFLEKAEQAGLSACREGYKTQWDAYLTEYGYK